MKRKTRKKFRMRREEREREQNKSIQVKRRISSEEQSKKEIQRASENRLIERSLTKRKRTTKDSRKNRR